MAVRSPRPGALFVDAVSVSLGTPEQNLSLARDRAAALVKDLRERGLSGQYTVSTTFTVDAASTGDTERSGKRLSSRTLGATPVVDANGKPLTTVSIAFLAPAGSA